MASSSFARAGEFSDAILRLAKASRAAGGPLGATQFRLRTLEKVSAEMSLHVLAYNLKRMIAILGVQPLIQAMRAA
jgi:hypothetical protein